MIIQPTSKSIWMDRPEGGDPFNWRYVSLADIRATVVSLIQDLLPAGLPMSTEWIVDDVQKNLGEDMHSLYLNFDRGWGIGATISVHHEKAPGPKTTIGDLFIHHKFSVHLGWSSTDRSVTHAVATLALYQEVVNFAALLDQILSAPIGEILPMKGWFAQAHGRKGILVGWSMEAAKASCPMIGIYPPDTSDLPDDIEFIKQVPRWQGRICWPPLSDMQGRTVVAFGETLAQATADIMQRVLIVEEREKSETMTIILRLQEEVS